MDPETQEQKNEASVDGGGSAPSASFTHWNSSQASSASHPLFISPQRPQSRRSVCLWRRAAGVLQEKILQALISFLLLFFLLLYSSFPSSCLPPLLLPCPPQSWQEMGSISSALMDQSEVVYRFKGSSAPHGWLPCHRQAPPTTPRCPAHLIHVEPVGGFQLSGSCQSHEFPSEIIQSIETCFLSSFFHFKFIIDIFSPF